MQATENLVPASSEVAVQASLRENPQFENAIPGNHVDQLAPTSSPIPNPHPQHNLYPTHEQPHQDHGRTTEQVVLSADAHEIGHTVLTLTKPTQEDITTAVITDVILDAEEPTVEQG